MDKLFTTAITSLNIFLLKYNMVQRTQGKINLVWSFS